MQVAEALPGEEIHDVMVFDKMQRKKPDASAPQDSLPVYFTNAGEDIEDYCNMV
jgi:hypothetical protein